MLIVHGPNVRPPLYEASGRTYHMKNIYWPSATL